MYPQLQSCNGGKKVIERCTLDELFFLLGLALWLFFLILSNSYYTDHYISVMKVGMYVGLATCTLAEILHNSITFKSLCLAIILILLIVLLHRVAANFVAGGLICAYASRNYKFRDTLLVGTTVIILAIVFVIVSNTLGFIPEYYDYVRNRRSLGFEYVTYLSHYWLEITMCYAILRDKKITWIELATLLAVNCLIWTVTDSRNSFVLTTTFIVIISFIKIINRWNATTLVARIAAGAFVASAALSAIIYLFINPFSSFGQSLNDLLSNRIVLTHQAMASYGIHAFGSNITWVTASRVLSGEYNWSQYLYVDCSYLNILINYGWVFFMLILAALTIVSYRATKISSVVIGISFTIFAIHGVVDPQLLYSQYCILLLLLGNVFDNQKSWIRHFRNLTTTRFVDKSTCKFHKLCTL